MRLLSALIGAAAFLATPPLFAQSQQQLEEAANFARTVRSAKDAGQCKKVVQLLIDRRAKLHAEAAALANAKKDRAAEQSIRDSEELQYLMTDIGGLENRLILERRDCEKN